MKGEGDRQSRVIESAAKRQRGRPAAFRWVHRERNEEEFRRAGGGRADGEQQRVQAAAVPRGGRRETDREAERRTNRKINNSVINRQRCPAL